MTHFTIAYHISLMNVQTNYYNNNLLILDVKRLNKIIKLYYFYSVKVLWDGQGKIKIYYRMSRVKKQLSGKRSIRNRSQPRSQSIYILIIPLQMIFSTYMWTHRHWAGVTHISRNLPAKKMLLDITRICSNSPTLKELGIKYKTFF